MARIETGGLVDKTHRVTADEAYHSDLAFHGTTIRGTVNKLIAAFGDPDDRGRHMRTVVGDKVSVEWVIAGPTGIFAIYDWEADPPADEHPDREYDFRITETTRGVARAAIADAASVSRALMELIR